MVYNEKTKEAVDRYRKKHPEKWREQMRKNARIYYEKNKERLRAQALERYYRLKTINI